MTLKKRRSIKKVISAFIISTFIIGSLSDLPSIGVQAVIDETNSVHINPGSIENSTLIIGTHLIYLGSMTDLLYETASSSQNDSGQYNIYYKSELTGGTWYNVTDAESIVSITSGGDPVSDSEIAALNMTHHTKSDGITYNLVTGGPVCICNIYDPYSADTLPELEPIKNQYDVLAEKDNDSKTETDYRDLALCEELWRAKPSSEGTDLYDKQIDALQKYYEILVRDEGDSEMQNMVQNVMGKLDASRRAVVFEILQTDILESLMSCVTSNKKYDRGDIYINRGEEAGLTIKQIIQSMKAEYERKIATLSFEEVLKVSEPEYPITNLEEFILNNSLVDGISDSFQNVEESLNEYNSKAISEGDTVLSKLEYTKILAAASAAVRKDYNSTDQYIKALVYIDRINNSQIREADEERALIENELLGAVQNKYKSSVGEGTGALYKALPPTSAEATRQAVLKRQKGETEGVRTELQFILQAKIDRMAPQEAYDYVVELLNGVNVYYNAIKADAYESYANASVKEYESWLVSTLSDLLSQLGGGELAALKAEEELIKEDIIDELQKEDLNAANKDYARLEVVQKKIKELEGKLEDVLSSDTATDAEKAEAAAALGNESTAGMVNTLKEKILEDLRDQDYSSADNDLNSLSALSSSAPDEVFEVFKVAYSECITSLLTDVDNESVIEDLMELIEELAADCFKGISKNGDVTEAAVIEALETFIEDMGLDTSGNGSSAHNGNNSDNSDIDTGEGLDSGNGAGSGSETGEGTGSGTGEGSGSGTGEGSGSGTGEGSGSGTGEGSGSGTGEGSGSGTGEGSGSGTGEGTGSGTGEGTGNGTGEGTGSGTGEGSGSGTGEGSGSGTGEGTGSGTGEGTGSGTGEGTGSGTGEGTGSGTGEGSGSGTGEGSGSGTGEGSGSGTGEGSGSGTGEGTGSGTGEGTGSGTGEGSGSGTGEGTGSGTGSGTDEGTGSGTGEGTGSGTGEGTGSGTGEGTGSGTGEGSGSGTGEGTGSGTGEGTGSGTGEGTGSGTGGGSGSGTGEGTGSGTGEGSGNGEGSGSGTGEGSGSGTGEGSGSGTGEGSGSGTGEGDGNGEGNGDETDSDSGNGSISSDQLMEILDSLNDDDLAAVIAGMNKYVEKNNDSTIKQIVAAYARKATSNGNPYFYSKLRSDKRNTYVVLDRLARILGLRYIFNDSKKQVILQRGSVYHKYNAFSVEVIKSNGSDEMERPASFQKTVYIDAEYAKAIYEIYAVNLNGCDFSVLMTKEQYELSDEFCDFLDDM